MRTRRFASQARETRVAAVLAMAVAWGAGGDGAQADDWLTARHDAQRTGRSGGRSNLAAPAIRWRHYLGGGVRGSQVLTADVDGDRTTDVVYLSSGRLRCKHADDALLWESGALDLTSVVGAADLDGDGGLEVIAVGARGYVGVFDGASGREVWSVPAALRGLGASARLADLDRDGVTDLYVGECVSNPLSAVAFSFRGARATPRELWRVPTLPDNACGSESDTVGDVDGDGAPEVILALGFSRMYVYGGADGRLRGEVQAPASSPFGGFTWTMLRQLDRDPALELVAFTNGYARIATPYGARRIAVFDQGASGALTLAWEATLAMPESAELRFEATSVRDLDGDGSPEITVSEYDPAARAWTLVVRAASDGRVIARQTGAEFLGVESLVEGATPVVLSLDNDRTLTARTLSAGTLRTAWTLDRARPLRVADATLASRERAAARPLLVQLDDDPALELVTAAFDPSVAPESRVVTEVTGWDLDGATPRALGTFRAPEGTTVSLALASDRLSRPYAQPVVLTSDGYLLALDRALQPTNRIVGAEFTIPGMRVGGFYAGGTVAGPSPIAGRVAATGSDGGVFVRDSRPVFLRLDVGDATLASPPRVRWSAPNLGPAMLADVNRDGTREVVAIDGRDVVAFDAADPTRTVWRAREVGGVPGSRIAYDVLPLRRGDGSTDVFFGRVEAGNVYRPLALDGRSGTVRWSTFARTPSSGLGHFALGDLNGDGTDDAVSGINTLVALDGARGEVLADREGAPYALPIIAPFSGTEPEVYVGGAFAPDRLVSRSLEVRGQYDIGNFSAPYGALLRCNDAPAVAITPYSTSQVVTLRPQSLPREGSPEAAVLARATLAGGSVYRDGAMVPSTATRGTFGALTAVADLDGRGTQALLIGATDGWLYALDACSLALLWSMDFHEPVGEAVVADTNGDGVDEVMITAGDGYLYGLGARTLGAPAAVREVEPPSDADLDEVETFDTLSVSWDSVPGASAYLVRPLSFGGTALRSPESVQVMGTSVTLRELPLLWGGRYRVGVTAVRADGSGVETLSDGVTVVDRSPPTVSITLSRPSFAPRASETVDLAVESRDRTGLARSVVEIRDAQGALVRTLDDYDARVRYASRSVRVTWGGTDMAGRRVPEGEYTVVGTATDVAGVVTTQRATLRVVLPAGASGSESGGGCGCRAGGERRSSEGAAWLAVALVAWAARQGARRGRPSSSRIARSC